MELILRVVQIGEEGDLRISSWHCVGKSNVAERKMKTNSVITVNIS